MSLQDYVKWRGQLFHQFMRALVDDSHEVRSLANYLLADALSSKVCFTHQQCCSASIRRALLLVFLKCIAVKCHMAFLHVVHLQCNLAREQFS